MSLISHNDYIRRVDLVSELRTMFEVQLTTTFVLSHHKHTRAIDLTTAIYEVYSYKGTNIQKKIMIQRKETTYDSTSSDDPGTTPRPWRKLFNRKPDCTTYDGDDSDNEK